MAHAAGAGAAGGQRDETSDAPVVPTSGAGSGVNDVRTARSRHRAAGPFPLLDDDDSRREPDPHKELWRPARGWRGSLLSTAQRPRPQRKPGNNLKCGHLRHAAANHDESANDNQMLYARRRAESARLAACRAVSKPSRYGGDGCESGRRAEGARRMRAKLIGRQRAAARGLIRALWPLLALGLVVMQIIAILPSCLIIYHGQRADFGKLLSAGLLPAVQSVAAATTNADDGDEPRVHGRPEVARQKVHVRVGILLEESNHEQANMFIRTIKMINDQKDETIRQLLNMFAAAKQHAGSARAGPHRRNQMQTTPTSSARANLHQRRDEGLAALPVTKHPREVSSETMSAVGALEERAEIKSGNQLAEDDDDDDDEDDGDGDGSQDDGRHIAKRRVTDNSQHWAAAKDAAATGDGGGNDDGPHPMGGSPSPNRLPGGGELIGREGNIAGDGVDGGVAGGANLESGPARVVPANVSLAFAPSMTAHQPDSRRASGPNNGQQRMTKSIRRNAAAAAELLATGRHQSGFDIELEPMIEFLHDRQSALEADEKVCQLIESGVYAIFGPTDGRSIQHIQSICDNLEIPYFELRPFIGSGGGGGGGGSPAGGAGGASPLVQAPANPSSSQLYVPSAAALVDAQALNADVGTSWPPPRRHSESSLTAAGEHTSDTDGDEAYTASDGANPDSGEETLAQRKQQSSDTSGAGEEALSTETAANRRRQAVLDNNVASSSSSSRPARHQVGGQTPSQQQPTPANKLEALTLNLYPPSHLLNSAYIDLIHALNWSSFAIVYEDSASMIKLQNIFKESSPFNGWTNRWRIRLFRHDPTGVYSELGSEYSGKLAQDGHHESETETVRHTGRSVASLVEPMMVSASNVSPSGTRRRNSSSHLSFLLDDNSDQQEGDHLRLRRSDELSSTTFQQQIGNNNNRGGTAAPRRDSSGSAAGSTSKNGAGGTYRDVFWRVKMSGEHNILLDIKTENLYETLKQAQQVGCMTEEYSYLITSLDLHTIDLEDFKYSRTKITGFSLTQVARNNRADLGLESSLPPLAAAAAAATATTTTLNHGQQLANAVPAFDERYLETLGVYMGPQVGSHTVAGTATANQRTSERQQHQRNASKSKNQKQQQQQQAQNGPRLGAFDWNNEAESNDETRREMLQSSPASLGLLPTVDRNNEQKLFDFFLEQQERNVSRVRLSTSSAIIHDSLMLYMLGLNEMDPSGKFLQASGFQSQPIYCSLESQPWLHGSSLVNYMKQTTFNGLTGFVSFDQRGLRSDFKLDVLGMAPNIRLVKIGEWHSKFASEDSRAGKFSAVVGGNQQGAELTSGHSGGRSGHGPGSLAGSGGGGGLTRVATATSSGSTGDRPSSARGDQPSTANDHLDGGQPEDSKSYDELSNHYENELRLYNQMLARGEPVHVPYKKRVSPNGALLVNSIIFERLYREQADKIDTLIVTAKLSQPYFMLRETPNKLDGNDQFEGYAVDLIHELSKLVNFKYKWREVADKKYGSKELLSNGTIVWNGMIGEIVRGTADLAIVDLTITAQREEAVDFTLPFMNTGISILFKKPTTKVTTLFSFLSPFSSDVWAYVLAAYCGISAILFLVGHLSPYEWADPHPCRHFNPEGDLTVLKNQFSLLNSFWFTIGSLMQQGSDLTPRSMSTRTIAGIWYFFTLIMISSYTANLAAFLTVEKVVYPIENVRDLSAQQEIKYGCVESGSTCLFFHDSQIDTYKKIDETMRIHRTYVRSNDEGQKRVGEGKFAFFMESTTIEYIIERNCNLTQIGGLLDSKGYGIALAKKSRHKRPYRTLLNEGILHLQETGMLHVLKNRWWKEKRGGGTCTDDGKGGGVTELSLANVGGVFVVLLGGLGISFLVALAEFIWRARRGGSSRNRMCEEMMNDLKFALACESSTKPIQRVAGKNNNNGTNGGSNNSSNNANKNNGGNGGSSASSGSNNPHLMRQRFAEGANLRRGFGGNPNGCLPRDFSQQSLVTAASLNNNNNNKCALNSDGTPGRAMDKRCNPILLHAMLTMLSPDQSHEADARYGPIGVSGGVRPNSVVAAPFATPAESVNKHPGSVSTSYLNTARSCGLYDGKFHGANNGADLRLMSNNGSAPESDYVDDDDDDDDGDVDDDDANADSEELRAGHQEEQSDNYSDLYEDEMMERMNVAATNNTAPNGRHRMTTDRSSGPNLEDVSRRKMLHSQKTIDID